MDTKRVDLQEAKLYGVSDESPYGSFSGYGSVYGNYDRVNEAVAPNAFKNLEDFKANGFIASGHAWDNLPIATIAEVKSDDYGLWIKADFHSHQAAQDARQVMSERLARGKSAGLSIGYTVLDAEPTSKGRVLKSLELFEISTVTVPANPLAGATDVKGMPLAGESFDDHRSRVLAEVKGLITRAKGVYDLRAKDNRTLSGDCRDDLNDLEAELKSLIALAQPKADPNAARALAARILTGAR